MDGKYKMMKNKQKSESSQARFRIGVDVGGTFTDFVLTNASTGEIVRYKEPSVPSDPSLSVGRGLPVLIERAGVRPEDVELLVHGTTLLVNAIIQRRGARVGLVVSRGHRGVLEIGRMSLDNSFDFKLRKEEALVPRNLVFEAGARIRADGDVVERPSAAELDRLAADLAAAGVEAITVLLLNSYAYPEAEREVAEALRRRLPGVPVTESAEIWPEQREFERGLVAIMNAYVQPLMNAYLARLVDPGGRSGGERPDLHHRVERAERSASIPPANVPSIPCCPVPPPGSSPRRGSRAPSAGPGSSPSTSAGRAAILRSIRAKSRSTPPRPGWATTPWSCRW